MNVHAKYSPAITNIDGSSSNENPRLCHHKSGSAETFLHEILECFCASRMWQNGSKYCTQVWKASWESVTSAHQKSSMVSCINARFLAINDPACDQMVLKASGTCKRPPTGTLSFPCRKVFIQSGQRAPYVFTWTLLIPDWRPNAYL